MAADSDLRGKASAPPDAATDGRAPREGEPPSPHWRHRPLRWLLAQLREQTVELLHQIRRYHRVLLVFLGVLFASGLLFAWSGVYSVAATQGHYPFFRWFLAYALRQSVETHTSGIRAPPLDDLAMVQRGAGHYQGGCAPCHGAPGYARNPITRRMLPEPPYLPDVIGNWNQAELFWIVKHGIKYAGMPAWAAPDREDEVWSVVAFLQRLPGMDPATYRQLAYGPVANFTAGAGEGLNLLLLNGPVGGGIAACARCHGFDGLGRDTAAFPRLTGQTADYLYETLKNYALGARPSGIMQPAAAFLSEEELRALAEHFASLNPPPPLPVSDADAPLLQLGRRIAHEGLPDRNIAACAGCHGPKEGPVHSLFPRLAAQHAEYIAAQLRLWKQGMRTRTELGRVMARAVGALYEQRASAGYSVARSLSEEEIRAVSLYYASLPPAEEDALAQRAPARP